MNKVELLESRIVQAEELIEVIREEVEEAESGKERIELKKELAKHERLLSKLKVQLWKFKKKCGLIPKPVPMQMIVFRMGVQKVMHSRVFMAGEGVPVHKAPSVTAKKDTVMEWGTEQSVAATEVVLVGAPDTRTKEEKRRDTELHLRAKEQGRIDDNRYRDSCAEYVCESTDRMARTGAWKPRKKWS